MKVTRWTPEAIANLETAYQSGGLDAVCLAYPDLGRETLKSYVAAYGIKRVRSDESIADFVARRETKREAFQPVTSPISEPVPREALSLPWLCYPRHADGLREIVKVLGNARACASEQGAKPSTIAHLDSNIAYCEALIARRPSST